MVQPDQILTTSPGYAHRLRFSLILLLFTVCTSITNAQNASVRSVNSPREDVFGVQKAFVENAGQYGDTLAGYGHMGRILWAYEGLGMPVLLTENGWVHLQRKLKRGKERDKDEAEVERERKSGKNGNDAEEDWEHPQWIDKVITLQWKGANKNRVVRFESAGSAYHTYASISRKAVSASKVIYENLYTGIDLVFSFPEKSEFGFEYSLVVKPNADLNQVQLLAGGDLVDQNLLKAGKILLQSSIGEVRFSPPVAYYGNQVLSHPSGGRIPVTFNYSVAEKIIRFKLPAGIDRRQTLVIDPFVTGTGNLTGLHAGKAKDVDFDYAGNVYVTGGGDASIHKLAKYDASGNLLWTFSGALTIPAWNFGTYWGGWMVEKPSGNIYLGQGFNPTTGFQVIRVTTNGLYDNFITIANPNFKEAWKMLWSCNNGSPQILVAGGGTSSNINFGVFTPPATTIGSLNVTGIPFTGSAGWAQDIVDFVIDPSNNDMYTLYGSLIGHPSLNNKVYKNTFPYSGASVVWNTPSGYTTVQEVANRPYLPGGQIDNSANIFALNASYLFYWDGKNLKAFNKTTGTTAGTPLVTANTALMQGGIIADACNNIFVGEGNGIIKVYTFNGTVFDDAAAPDIVIPGYTGKAVYDLAYDESKKLIYASGDGFVGSFDISAYCPGAQYTLVATPNCTTASATITVTPAPLAGSTITYVLYIGNTPIASNTTGVFSGLEPGISYTVTATINQLCSGAQATTSFMLPGPAVTLTAVNATCGNATGSITATASGSTAPYTYSIDGITFLGSPAFNGLAAGVYSISVRDANGCTTKKQITVLNLDGPTLTSIQTNADCGVNTGTITGTATGGTAPYQYSLNGGPYQGSNFFTGLPGGNYILTVKDATGCTNSLVLTLSSSTKPSLLATPGTASCGKANGSITAFGSGGTAPLQYSINGNTYQASGSFPNLLPGTYTVYVKDANGCSETATVTIGNSAPPTATAVSTPASCTNINGTVTVTGTGGIAPLEYSINGSFFQTSNIFFGLAPGTYTVTVQDATGCTSTTTITVGSVGGPTVTANSTVSACNSNTGTITIAGGAGTAPYTYSINGTLFQPSGNFIGLAPGNYVAYCRDLNGCITTTLVSVGVLAGPSLTLGVTPTACNTNTGSIIANGTGGTAPLTYSIDGITYQAGNTFNGLATGSYTVYVKDANGCTRYAIATITNVSGLLLTLNALFSSCSTNTGSITATAQGGVAPLTYSIDGITYTAGNVFSGLGAGTYTVYVKDASGCTVSKQSIIQSVTGPLMTVTKADATCGGSNGVIIARGTGGIAPLTYNIDGGAFQANGYFVSVAAGTHTITVKDASGCTSSQTVVIANSGAGTLPTDVTFRIVDALACLGQTGRIKNLKGVPSGGGLKYTFSLDLGPFTTANQFTNVLPGLHTITAMNEEGCKITKLVTIGSGTAATAIATAVPATCNTPNGSITISGTGANTPYHASIDNGITWNTFFPPGANSFTYAGLAPGTYRITMADDADFTTGPPDIPGACQTSLFVVVPASNGPAVSVTQINGTCNSPTGSITATGSGGTPPYTYNINGGAFGAANVFNNLLPGTYAIGIQDGTGCTSGISVTLTNNPNPQLTATGVSTSCNNSNGTITAIGTGGVAPLQYSINGTSFQNSNTFTNLAPGTYTVYVKDAGGCYSTTNVTITNTPLPRIAAYTIPSSCLSNDGSIVAIGTQGEAPYTYSINGTAYQSSGTFTNLPAGFYTVYIKDNRGCITTTGVVVSNLTGPAISNTVVVNANCGHASGSITIIAAGGVAPLEYSIDGLNFQPGNSFPNLLPGNYTILVRDASGCVNARNVAVINKPGPQQLTASILAAACGQTNGAVTATASGGTAPYQYSINGTTYQAGASFTNLGAGTYTLYVKDVNGCILSLPVTVTNLPGPLADFTSTPASCNGADGSVTATSTGGTGALTYSIDGITFQSSPVFTGLSAGTYTITVKDTRGCTNTTLATVTTLGTTITPAFVPVGPICAGTLLAPLPTTSLNGITGTWTPALNNSVTTTYFFTPNGGQCAASTTLTIVVNPNVVPTFSPVAAICSGTPLSPLPTTSTNGVTGTWAPILNNTATTTYTFTPSSGQCASPTTLTITVNPAITPTFAPVAAICSGSPLAALPTTSLNGITGTWAPALNNTATTTYTFTPTAGQCATASTLTITVNPNITPTFTPVAAICSGSPLAALPTTSLNGITGTWAPALNNTITTTYTFTPTAGQCATTTTLTITVNPNITPTFTQVPTICFGGTITPLPTTSLNGISGTWAPALNNTTTTTYTFTPDAGLCANTVTMTIGVNNNTVPTFNPVAAVCSGATMAPLPTTSLNGITGSWTPAMNNTATTVYTFTPDAGQCAVTSTLTITVNPNVTPTFTPVAAICAGGVLAPLPTTSTNGITGTWAPALNNTATTTYTFTPTAGQCATTTTLTITVNPNITPTFTQVPAICFGGTINPLPTTSLNGITGTWAPALNNTTTTTYTFTPHAGQCANAATMTIGVNNNTVPTFNPVAAVCSGATMTPLPTTSLNGITGSWTPALNNTSTTVYTFTPDAGQCAVTSTLTITVNPNVTPTFTPVAAICSGSPLAALPTTSLNGITGTWAPALNNTTTTTYTFTPTTGQCATTTTLTITVNPNITPTFAQVPAICFGGTINPLPTTSLNGITGSWAPALNNTTTTTYTFTPTAGQCATATTLTITVNPNVTPTFTPVAAICAGGVLAALPTTSTNGITGTWAPALNNTATTIYTFTPDAGQCATTTTLTITVNPNITPTFTQVPAICFGGTINPLPTTSLNGITGTWAPALNNTTTTTYTFTPHAGQCANAATMTIGVNNNTVPTFNPVAAICTGATLAPLPAISLNGITGSWTPALNNTVTTTYTFTPDAGQCAVTNTLIITVNPNITPTFTPIAAICSGLPLTALPTTSLNGITGTWAPALNNTATTTYTFSPTAGQCATTTTLTITVNPNITPTFTQVPAICFGGTINPLPTTSLNGITGTWTPAINNTTTTTYSFTPDAGQCASIATMTIGVNNNTIPTFTAIPAICAGETLAALPTTSINGITGIWAPALNNIATTTYTFTPDAGQCAINTSLTITVIPNTTPTFTPVAAICSGVSLAALPTTSLNGIIGTWAPALNNTVTTTYTFTPIPGQCATTTTLTITVNPNITPTFSPVAAICSGSPLAALPTTSLNGITGTWTPGLNNTSTTTYTFTPDAGQCATSTTLTITVNPASHPIFSQVAAICVGGTITPLPTTSLNGITGTWAPAINNTVTTTYTFTPDAGQCATTATMTIGVNNNTVPTFTGIAAICSGGTLTPLPTTSINGITGTWTPSLNNTVTTTYTFTPDGGQCAISTTLTILVNATTTPAFTQVASICAGSALNPLPTTALNGITGTWAPAINNTTTTTYTFTPDANQCATTTTMTIGVNNNTLPTFTPVSGICAGDFLAPLPTTSTNGITGTWSPALNNTATTTYTFTPDPGQCASTVTVTIGVNNNTIPTFTEIPAACEGTAMAPLPLTSLNGITGTWTPALNNTVTTTYTFTPNAGQCAQGTTLTIVINALPQAPVLSLLQPNCTAANGTATITSGTTGLLFSLDGGAYQNYPAGGYTGLLSGIHQLVARNSIGCISPAATFTINPLPVPPTAFVVTATAATCGNANGALDAGPVTGGTAPYLFSLDGGTFSAATQYNGLAAGSHSLTVKDANGCTLTETITLSAVSGATLTATATNSFCGQANGTINATATGGTAPYFFTINNGTPQASGNFNNLPAGNYLVTLRDASNCISTQTVILTSIPGAQVTATATPSTCGNADGSITATGTGGTAPYQFALNGGAFQQNSVFTGLTPGTYSISIKDGNNCISTVVLPVALFNPITVAAGNDTAICEGSAVLLNGSSNGTVFSWTPAAGLSNPAILRPLAAPRQTTTYILTASIGNCVRTDTMTITVIAAPQPDAGPDIIACYGAAVQLQGSGGTGYRWTPAGLLNNADVAKPLLKTAEPGTYRFALTVTNAQGCQSLQVDSVSVTIRQPLSVYAGKDTVAAIGQPIQLVATDTRNAGFTSYSWSPGTGLNNPKLRNPIAILNNDITYVVTATDVNGCEAKDDIHIRVFAKADLYVPNAFTPNRDGKNDALHIIPVGIRELKYFRVFNRWGQLVFSSEKLSLAWDGTVNGQSQATGTYVWIAEAVDYNGKLIKKSGTVTLIH